MAPHESAKRGKAHGTWEAREHHFSYGQGNTQFKNTVNSAILDFPIANMESG